MAQEITVSGPGLEVSAINLSWRGLYRIGGAAALLCFVMYLITLGIYIPANLAGPPPETVTEWFTAFEESPITGLFFLGLGDAFIMIFWIPLALALFALLRQSSKTWASVALPFVFVGAAVYLATSPAFSMLSLSQEFAVATTESEQAILLAAGQAMLAISRGTGFLYAGMPLVWLAGLVFSVVMLRSRASGKATSWVGMLGFGLLLVGIPFGGHYTATGTPSALQGAMVAVQYVGGGMLSMVWYFLVGLRLLRIGLAVEPTL